MRISQEIDIVFLKLPARNIAYLKSILESYEGIGELRTLNAERGEIAVMATVNTSQTVRELVKELADELEMREIPEPVCTKGDWLFSACKKEFEES